jgi:hypothetical protein
MKITTQKLRQIIKEELNRIIAEDRKQLDIFLDKEEPAEVTDTVQDAWEGGEHTDVEDANLVLPIDHVAVYHDHEVVDEPEILQIVDED